MRKPWIRATTLGCCLVLAGCADMQGLDQMPRARAHSPQDYGATPVQWPGLFHPGARYEDPALDALLSEALQGNPDLSQARDRLMQAQAYAEEAGAARLPTLNLEGSAQARRYAAEYDAGPPLAGAHGMAAVLGVQAGYTFDFWGGQRAAMRAALGEAAAAEGEWRAARLLLVCRLQRGWFELAGLLVAQTQTREGLELRRQTLELVRMRRAAGLDTDVQVAQARADVSASLREGAALAQQIGLQRHALAALAGLPLHRLAHAAPALPQPLALALPPALPAELIAQRPEVVAARWRVEAAGQRMQAAKAAFYPNIDLRLFAGLARQSATFGLRDWLHAGSRQYGIEPAISLPLFDGGRLRARWKGRAAQFDEAVHGYNQALLVAVRDVADQVLSLQALATQRAEQGRSLQARQRAFALARAQYQAGLADYLTVLTAQDALLRDRRLALDLQIQTVTRRVELERALGGSLIAAAPENRKENKHDD
ncbi:efflux transporter outer membrane subunit [Bordetella trematum]|uniref:efflux transporter outer membrane subunit n=1 Tax=Bordetella trematum TaxID=123899 RepID=UPI0009DE1BFE|nr:efflux transporter outer membrane subunit [Bordetella trematum]